MNLLRRTTYLAAVLAVAAGATTADPAAAHPLGDPQTIEVAAEGHRVRIRWGAAADDLTALALHLGLLPDARTFVYDDGVLVPEESDASDAALLASAPQLSRYLLDHIQVGQVGEPCPGQVTSSQGLSETGTADLVFTCPGEVGRVIIEVSTLTDLHSAYRTLATGGGGQRATYTAETRVHRWRLGAGTDTSTEAHPPIVALGVLTLGAGASYVGIRRRRAAKRGAGR